MFKESASGSSLVMLWVLVLVAEFSSLTGDEGSYRPLGKLVCLCSNKKCFFGWKMAPSKLVFGEGQYWAFHSCYSVSPRMVEIIDLAGCHVHIVEAAFTRSFVTCVFMALSVASVTNIARACVNTMTSRACVNTVTSRDEVILSQAAFLFCTFLGLGSSQGLVIIGGRLWRNLTQLRTEQHRFRDLQICCCVQLKLNYQLQSRKSH